MKKITFILMMLSSISMFAQGIPEITFNIEDGETIKILEKRYIHIYVSAPEGQDVKSEIYLFGEIKDEAGKTTPVGGITTFEDGIDISLTRFTSGVPYVIEMTKVCYGGIIGYDEVTHDPIYKYEIEAEEGKVLASAHFSIIAEAEIIEVVSTEYKSSENALFVTFGTEDACPIDEDVVFLVETADGKPVDVTVGWDFGENYGDMIYTFSQPLTDGDYVLVLPAKTMSFSLSGIPYNAVVRVPFTVCVGTDVNKVFVVKPTNAKVVENGKLVIVRNNIKYNIAGVELK